MEKDHHLDAPDNENLQHIEQLPDRSGLSTMYPGGHNDWEGKELLSYDERESRRDEAQLRISTSIRRWFWAIGILVPLPFILASALVGYASGNFDSDNIAFLFVPAAIAIAATGYITYRSFRFLHSVFYKHAMRAMPFVITLTVLVGLSVYGLLLATQNLHTGVLVQDILVIGSATILTSMMYSGILLLVWTSQTLNSLAKVGVILGLVSAIVALTTAAHFLL